MTIPCKQEARSGLRYDLWEVIKLLELWYVSSRHCLWMAFGRGEVTLAESCFQQVLEYNSIVGYKSTYELVYVLLVPPKCCEKPNPSLNSMLSKVFHLRLCYKLPVCYLITECDICWVESCIEGCSCSFWNQTTLNGRSAGKGN